MLLCAGPTSAGIRSYALLRMRKIFLISHEIAEEISMLGCIAHAPEAFSSKPHTGTKLGHG